ncbi:TPA: ATP-binding protein [Raoultella ornithinolytica]|nr:ATP-binding protein [Raoultella ornithinolytica]
MNVAINSLSKFNGFKLNEEFCFSGNLCILIGKNGSGKSRLFDSFSQGCTTLKVDEVQLGPDEIGNIKFKQDAQHLFSGSDIITHVKNLSNCLMNEKVGIQHIGNLPETKDLSINFHNRDHSTINVPVRDLYLQLEAFFRKNFQDIVSEEIELFLFSKKTIHELEKRTTPPSLNTLVVSYYQSIYLNEYLKFLESKESTIHPISAQQLYETIGNDSPHVLLNDILKRIFKGKFHLSDPDSSTRRKYYNPQILLTSDNSIINYNHLSDGEKNILFMATSVYEAYMSFQNLSFTNKKVILLDEPDAHLHPQMIIDFFDCINTLSDKLNIIFIISTHSPTTVALCPTENIFSLIYNNSNNQYKVEKNSKDAAISQLLEGATQLLINSENSRQVYVENENDSRVYLSVYNLIKNKAQDIDKNIILNFISAGPKLADSELKKHIISVYGESDSVELLVSKINGDASCSQVIGMVESLINAGHKNVRGVIDWDNEDRGAIPEIIVMAKNNYYSMENIIYDPVSIFVFLCVHGNYELQYFQTDCKYQNWREALEDMQFLQIATDKIISDVLGRDNRKDHEIHYFGGLKLLSDKDYHISPKGENGHALEGKITNKYHVFQQFIAKNRSKKQPLILSFLTQITITNLGVCFLNKSFEDTFRLLQK